MSKNLRNKWEEIEGVVFPKAKSVVAKSIALKSKPPRGFITTKQAADILMLGYHAAYMKLKKHKTKFVMMKLEGLCPQYFWRKAEVEKLADKAPPLGSAEIVKNLLSMAELCQIVGVSRPALVRAIQKGKLHAVAYRMPTGQGRQKRFFFAREEVERYVESRKNSPAIKKAKKSFSLK